MKTAWIISAVVLLTSALAGAAKTMLPVPPRHFNDYAKAVPAPVAQKLDQQLADFEKRTSNQVLVVVYPAMPSDSSVEDYTVRVAQAWHVGQKGRDNGVVLFVFVNDHKLYIQVGYGLEGALPDAICKRIIEDEIKPFFKRGDYAGGLTAGVNAILLATKGEYKPSGAGGGSMPLTCFVIAVLVTVPLFFILLIALARRQGGVRRFGTSVLLGSRTTWSSGGFGGGFGGGGGGGFSSGGGSFGGGGAGGSW